MERPRPQEVSKHEGYGQSYGRRCFHDAPPAKTSELYGRLEMQGIQRICSRAVGHADMFCQRGR